ncbi:MAG: Ldh family oxidoreductase [Candidatus Dojkabacteria bacterium]
MKLEISDAKTLSIRILKGFGFSKEEAELSTENFIEGELTGKKSHGLVRIPWLKKKIETGSISLDKEEIEIAKETPVSILIDGKKKTGFYVVNKALDLGIEKVSKSGICVVGTTNTSEASGLIGLYARKAAEKDLIFIGFNNSPSAVAPYGSSEKMFGTNPFTVGIPYNNSAVILDFATSKGNVGDVLKAIQEGETLPKKTYLDKNGNYTTDPTLVFSQNVIGALLPIAGHKGSGLGFIVELLGGALTSSRVGKTIEGGWGSLMILIDPNIIRDLEDFKSDVQAAIGELKSSRKMEGFEEIFYPGEQSQRRRQQALEQGYIEIDDKLYSQLMDLSEEFSATMDDLEQNISRKIDAEKLYSAENTEDFVKILEDED